MARLYMIGFAAILASSLALPVLAQTPARATGSEDFFIIASVNAKKNELVLKLPTEVTELMRVTDKTVCQGRDGTPLKFDDFRAGDTVFISYARNGAAVAVARSIRKGPMTVAELHRRYLSAGTAGE